MKPKYFIAIIHNMDVHFIGTKYKEYTIPSNYKNIIHVIQYLKCIPVLCVKYVTKHQNTQYTTKLKQEILVCGQSKNYCP